MLFEKQNIQQPRFFVTKEDLESMVWAMPTTSVAKHFGVSDKPIEKRCKLLGIQKPPRGYWAKQFAQAEKRVPPGQL